MASVASTPPGGEPHRADFHATVGERFLGIVGIASTVSHAESDYGSLRRDGERLRADLARNAERLAA